MLNANYDQYTNLHHAYMIYHIQLKSKITKIQVFLHDNTDIDEPYEDID